MKEEIQTTSDSIKDQTSDSASSNFNGQLNKKLEKLSTAIYMVTSYMEENEPLKKSLRELSIALLIKTNSINKLNKKEILNDALSSINNVISLLSISRTISLISEMNFSILLSEFKNILNSIEQEKLKDESFLQIDFGFDFNNEKYQTVKFKENNLSLIATENTLIKKAEETKKENTVIDKKVITPFLNTVKKTLIKTSAPEIKERKLGRRENVLAILSKTETLTIKDLTLKIKGCSEKTIQRELNQLLEEKKIKRIGEKRWSKYLLS